MENLKIQELERRISHLEQDLLKTRFNYFLANKKSEQSLTKHTFNYDFVVKSACYMLFEISINCAIDGFFAKIYINGATVAQLFSDSKTLSFKRVLPFSGGKNAVSVVVENEAQFDVENCEVSVFGDIEYSEINSILSVINESDKSIILFVVNGELYIKEYKTQLKTILKKSDVAESCICKLANDYLLTVADFSGNAFIYLYDSEFKQLAHLPLDQSVSSVCALSGLNQSTVFAVKGNCVYRYDVDEKLNLVATKTKYRAKKVSGNPSVQKYIIITDHAGNGKIVQV